MSDELCRSMAAKWVREHSCPKGARNMTVKDFNETMLQAANFPENFPKKIGLTTARKFLHDLGFSRTDTSKRGVYKDGHERPDVVSYRKVYVQRLQTLEKNHSAPSRELIALVCLVHLRHEPLLEFLEDLIDVVFVVFIFLL